MSGTTEIQWTATYNPDGTVTPGRTWNPVVGCERVSAGCKNCYAYTLHDMRHKAKLEGKKLPDQYLKPFNHVQIFPDRLRDPLSWKKPGKVFVNSVSDLFHDDVPFEFIGRVWETMGAAHWLTFQILTKRPKRMLEYFQWCKGEMKRAGLDEWWKGINILPNVWLGVSVEDQRVADERIPLLLQVPAAVRFLSCEPLLGPVDLRKYLRLSRFKEDYEAMVKQCGGEDRIPDHLRWNKELPPMLHWVIGGGESGPRARPCEPDWARALRDDCRMAGVAFFWKQWGEWGPYNMSRDLPEEMIKLLNPKCMDKPMRRHGKKLAGRLLDGREHNEYPGPQ